MKTRIAVEPFLGDSMKVIAVQIDDLFELDRLQTDEILALIEGRVLSLRTPRKFTKRPKPSASFMENYNSGNFYTLTKSLRENCPSDRMGVIEKMAEQIITHDSLSPSDVLQLCKSYIRAHLSDGEEATDLPDTPD